MIRPSALPMLAECPKFEGAPSKDTDRGLLRHKAIAAYLGGDEKALSGFEEEEHDNLLWAAEQIRLFAPILNDKLIIERTRKAVLPTGVPIVGTPDFTCGSVLLDLKWRFRDYRAQMAAYSYMLLAEGAAPPITAHLLFAESQTRRVLSFDMESSWETIKPILEKVDAPFAVATPCTFCGWCAKRTHCEALIQQVNIALQSNPEWSLPQWHSSQMTTAKEIGLALRIARTLADWCDSVEFHAKEMATKQGIVAEGFSLSSRRGNRFVASVTDAFAKVGLPQKEFLEACTIKPKALFELYASFHGMKKAPAEREVESKLGDTIQRAASSTSLVQDKLPKD